jgi:hypothetical protein
MNCKVEWSEEFIDSHLTKTFRNGDLRKHREKVLIDRGKAQITEVLPYAEMYKDIDRANEEIEKLQQERLEILKKERDLRERIQTQLILKRGLDDTIRDRTRQRVERREFVMKCPSDDCRGFLSTAWKCGICAKHFCSECHAQKAEGHECNEEAKASATLIRKETHPCPKCGIRISKIDGCDQMWCTQCQTAFSWKTGQIAENTRVHNPHYYEYLRRVNNGVVPREPGDGVPVPFQCDNNRYAYGGAFERGMRFIWRTYGEDADTTHIATEVIKCFRTISHIHGWSNPHLRRSIENTNFEIRQATCEYLLNKVNEDEWGKRLVKIERANQQNRNKLQLLETFVQVGDQQIAECLDNTTLEKVKHFLTEMHKVRLFINDSFEQLAKVSGTKAKKIPDDWEFRS